MNERKQPLDTLVGYCFDFGFCSERGGESLEGYEQRGAYSNLDFKRLVLVVIRELGLVR